MADAELRDPDRPAFIQRVVDSVLKQTLVEVIPRVSRAFLWLCHIDNLRRIADDLEAPPMDDDHRERVRIILNVLSNELELLHNIIRPWLGRTRQQNMFRTETNPSNPNNFKKAAIRDVRCIIQKTLWKDVLQGAHICPYAMSGERDIIWDYLKIFWPAPEVDAWLAFLRAPQQTEALENIITMDLMVHGVWDRCGFALQPVDLSEDGRVLTLKFYWLKQGVNSKFGHTREQMIERPGFSDNLTEGPFGLPFYNCLNKSWVTSGTEIRLKTVTDHPLPSFELLNLQWHLQRVIAMVGGTEILKPGLSDDSDDDGDDWYVPALSSSVVSKLF